MNGLPGDTPSLSHFGGFRSASEVPRLQPDPAFFPDLDRSLADLEREGKALGLRADFVRGMIAGFVDAFRWLDALARDDPFWIGTNGRPTRYKLSDFCEERLRNHPGDVPTLRARVAVRTIHSAFAPSEWVELIAADGSTATWAVDAALVAECLGSYDTLPDLLAVSEEIGPSGRYLPRLREILGSEVPHASEWARLAIEKLDGT